eukprot:CAMPEP_0205822454 /NCGR_PEP_ID=MMETSP0206-20130828/12573_1 /ASSEMBLY_ACC=CAM_ASM_000279 /TAXON_ID=36767 /ORGANISM="Euplotes focardii, Strain TN1" /LENGTH=109 /DNA_ID=CAMNT_0053118741 /DNA_START=52 /DNA_END=378 /DNA_ORIENTATION=+
MGIENTVIPARFLTLLGHFVALMMLYYTPEGNVNASIPVVHTQKQFDHATQQLDIAIRLGLACFAIEFAGLFGGFSLFEPAYNALYITCHFVGGVLTCWFLLDLWNYVW